MRFKSAFLVLVTALLLGYGAWYRYGPLEVNILHAQPGLAIEAIYATGQVEPSVLLPIAPRIAGYLTALPVQEGQQIRKGQILAQLSANDLARTVDEQNARAQYAQQQRARTASLVAQGFYSGAELDRVTAEANATQAALRRARALQSYTTILAPADGLILRRDVEVGQFVNAGQVLMSMSCCAPLRVSAEVDEEDIEQVRVGQTVVLQAPALGQKVLAGHVESITPKGDPIARSYRVRIAVKNHQALRVGMTIEANLIVQQKERALLLANEMIQDEGVWLHVNGRAVFRRIHFGIKGSTKSEILTGLTAQEQIIWPIPKGIREGRRLAVKNHLLPIRKSQP